ncbi:MAG: fumarylacetoacetate hydrolase family protein [Planctomycetales bacterium]|nr:fumarylacetoacetate hydrolase family protein [Planctomycetales bacterium]
MQLGKLIDSQQEVCVGRIIEQTVEVLDLSAANLVTLSDLLACDNIQQTVSRLPIRESLSIAEVHWLPPIDSQEVWAAGVTYKRSQTARMEESEAAASCYDRVYQSARPEIFFKASPHRVRGHLQNLRIRVDATWNVPEPELTLVLSPDLRIVGFTIGNDMSSRDIEGDNPLYLPQAKCYNECCGLGPWITLTDQMPMRDEIDIRLEIFRNGSVVFSGETSAGQMARSFQDLVNWLGRDNSFPQGAFLLTGTGIVPNSDFTLAPGDQVDIHIAGIGTLSNTIVQG